MFDALLNQSITYAEFLKLHFSQNLVELMQKLGPV